jgi:hypothetical protein
VVEAGYIVKIEIYESNAWGDKRDQKKQCK